MCTVKGKSRLVQASGTIEVAGEFKLRNRALARVLSAPKHSPTPQEYLAMVPNTRMRHLLQLACLVGKAVLAILATVPLED